MRVFDLRCTHDHRFEGWFASSEAFEDQLARTLVACPLCGSTDIQRLPSAPHLNLSASRESRMPASKDSSAITAKTAAIPAASVRPDAEQVQALQAQWLKMAREVVRNTENVGEHFAEEARRIHYNEAPERAIRGTATPEQVEHLADEGINVVALPIPDLAKEPLQ